jgi:hypothetical protein
VRAIGVALIVAGGIMVIWGFGEQYDTYRSQVPG